MTTAAFEPVVGEEMAPISFGPVDEQRMRTMSALMRDPNPIHWDVASVQSLGLGDRVINQGPNNMAYIVNAVAAWSGGFDRIVSTKVRFLANVFGGDRLVVRGRVSALDSERVTFEVHLMRGDETLLSGTAVVGRSAHDAEPG